MSSLNTFDDLLRERILANISSHDRREHELVGRRHAAVAIVVVKSGPAGDGARGRQAAFLLCRRATKLRAHAGQWALPGGRCDDGESVEQAALRELHEELDLQLGLDAVLGVLDDYPTRSGYVITPVVVWAGGDVRLRPNPTEVAFVHRIALDELCRPDSPRFIDIPESDNPVVQLPLGVSLVHAPTAAVLVQFRWVALDGRTNERVDSFEQPTFAWR